MGDESGEGQRHTNNTPQRRSPSQPVQPLLPSEGWSQMMVHAGRTSYSLSRACLGGPAPCLGLGRDIFTTDCIIPRDLETWPEIDTKGVPYHLYHFSIVYNKKK